MNDFGTQIQIWINWLMVILNRSGGNKNLVAKEEDRPARVDNMELATLQVFKFCNFSTLQQAKDLGTLLWLRHNEICPNDHNLQKIFLSTQVREAPFRNVLPPYGHCP